jgi:CTP synthase
MAARFARENLVPYFGLCLGLQVMVIELARQMFGDCSANSTEFAQCAHPVVDLMLEQRSIQDKGGTMRLGSYPCALTPGTHARAAYGAELIHERHRHRYEINNTYRDQLAAAGIVWSGQAPDGQLMEIGELRDHPWMLGSQFHPEFKSHPDAPHPLFRDFVAAAIPHGEA